MVININKKPVTVTEETANEQGINWVSVGISSIGYTILLSLMDYVSFLFLHIHPIPLIKYVTSIILYLL